jgi:hypothetical protein
MHIYLSENLRAAHPGLEEELREVHAVSRRLDPFIRTRDLFVYGRCSRYSDATGGHAWDQPPAGKITLSIGWEASREDRIRLFAHELRHVGQMHRGKKKHGYLTWEHMNGHCEADAIDFEEKVVKAI